MPLRRKKSGTKRGHESSPHSGFPHHGPVIEEVGDDEVDGEEYAEPIVEEPGAAPRGRAAPPSGGMYQDPFAAMMADPFGMGGGGGAFGGMGLGGGLFGGMDPFAQMQGMMQGMHTAMGAGGAPGEGVQFYSSTTTTTGGGPGGVQRVEQETYDSRAGTRSRTVRRTVDGQSRVEHREWDERGGERRVDRLENMREEDADAFEERWEQRQGQLPRWAEHGGRVDPNERRRLGY